MKTKTNWGEAFKLYDQQNPTVFVAFKQFAEEWRAAGHSHCGAGMIFERIRWETGIRAGRELGLPVLKLNNNYRAYYARKLVAEDPEKWRGFFEFREVAEQINITDKGWATV